MFCERCGYKMADNITICPNCGTASAYARPTAQPTTSYGPYPQYESGQPPSYQQGYPPPPNSAASTQPNYMPPPPQPNGGYASPGYGPTYHAIPMYTAGPGAGNATYINNITFSNKNDNALIVEIILSLFGIFGVGWLMAGETTVGIVMLICSIVIYWPLMLAGTIFTLGIGLICLGPIAIAAIIVNALVFNSILKRKATQYIVMQQMPPMQAPPYP